MMIVLAFTSETSNCGPKQEFCGAPPSCSSVVHLCSSVVSFGIVKMNYLIQFKSTLVTRQTSTHFTGETEDEPRSTKYLIAS